MPRSSNKLTAIEALIVAPQIRPAERIAIMPIRPKGRVISRCVMELAIVLRMISGAVVGIPRTVIATSSEAFVIDTLYQGRNSVRRRRWWWCVVVRGAAGHKKCGR